METKGDNIKIIKFLSPNNVPFRIFIIKKYIPKDEPNNTIK